MPTRSSKRPKDANQLAKFIVELGDRPDRTRPGDGEESRRRGARETRGREGREGESRETLAGQEESYREKGGTGTLGAPIGALFWVRER